MSKPPFEGLYLNRANVSKHESNITSDGVRDEGCLEIPDVDDDIKININHASDDVTTTKQQNHSRKENTRRSCQLDVPRDTDKLSCDNGILMTTSEKHNDVSVYHYFKPQIDSSLVTIQEPSSNANAINYDLSVNHNSATYSRGLLMLLTHDFTILSKANMRHRNYQHGVHIKVTNAYLNKLIGYNHSMPYLNKHIIVVKSSQMKTDPSARKNASE
ncbi:hypothetical protein GJ496_005713 [Pomphorhynchus laevis]|nr:hypothetical protein GJ496_005713 [Pomphorhynchus laevis]